MESGSQKDCWQSGINPATPFTGINPDQNWTDDDEICIKYNYQNQAGECYLQGRWSKFKLELSCNFTHSVSFYAVLDFTFADTLFCLV